MSNIQIGIDLGTTNSEIAIINNGTAQVIKNTYGDEFTPSVFGVNKAGNEEVGKKPYQRYFKDTTPDEIANNKPEIKRLMGTAEKVYFPRLNKHYSAEEISSKILLSLKQDAIQRSSNLSANAAVITIPAHFGTTQAEATKRAGILAGFEYVVLLQEPIAAAFSYGFGRSNDEIWLVYDLGGGTFDCTLISCKDGNLRVLELGGDNFLGGKDIDALIVDEWILPNLNSSYNIAGFGLKEQDKTALAKLKYIAEQAKIALSSSDKTNIEVDLNINGQEIYENIPITRSNLQSIMQPMLDKTLHLCEDIINKASLKKEAINKIILVGGPTQLPFVKQMLESKLGISVDTSSDPLTAVARGACIYAMGQRIPQEFIAKKTLDKHAYVVNLNYDTLTSDEEQLITGKIEGLNNNGEYFVQIQSDDNSFNSGKIALRDGKFSANLVIKKYCLNIYYIYLSNKNGNVLNTDLNEFRITHGLSTSGAPLPRSIGVAISEMDFSGNIKQKYHIFFERNLTLPLEKTETFKAFKNIKRGDKENSLPITIYEGENSIPDKNLFICELELTGAMLNASLSEGSQIDLTIKISESQELQVEAYIPSLDKAFEVRGTTYSEDLSINQLEEELEEEIKIVRENSAACTADEKIQIQREIDEIKKSISKAKNDNDEKRKANSKIKELAQKTTKLKEANSADEIKEKFENSKHNIEKTLNGIEGNKRSEFQKEYETIIDDAQKALKAGDMGLLNMCIEALEGLEAKIMMSDDSFWIGAFEELRRHPQVLANPRSNDIIQRGVRALNNDDIDTLQYCVRELVTLLPLDKQADIGRIAGISR